LSCWGEYNDEMLVAVDRVNALETTPDRVLDQVQKRMQWKWDRILRRWDATKEQRLKDWSNYDAR
jgi:hypothetical protein